MGIFSTVEKGIYKANPIRVFGQVTTNKDGVVIGPKKNGFGKAYDKAVDAYVAGEAKEREAIFGALLHSPFDHVSIGKDGVTIGAKKNLGSKIKKSIVDFLK